MSNNSPVLNADFAQSVIRVWTAIIVGGLLSLLLKYGVDLDSATLTIVVGQAVTATYYLVARIVENKWPKAPVLGSTSVPAYVPPDTEALTIHLRGKSDLCKEPVHSRAVPKP